jgi:predicted DNA-binding transcriptional regulator
MQEKLEKMGLNKTESSIYLVLIEYSKLTPARISKITGINRTTIYAALSELVKKGLILEDLTGKIKYFVVLSPENLLNYTKRQKQEILQKEKIAQELVLELELLPKSKNFSIPKIQFVEGKDIKDFLYEKTPVWEQSMIDVGEKTLWGFQDHTFVENEDYRDWIFWYWKRVDEGFNLKMFTNQSDIEEEMKGKKLTNRMLKFWNGDDITSTQWILGEYIISIVTRGKLHYLVQIRDVVLAESMKNFVKHSWFKE